MSNSWLYRLYEYTLLPISELITYINLGYTVVIYFIPFVSNRKIIITIRFTYFLNSVDCKGKNVVKSNFLREKFYWATSRVDNIMFLMKVIKTQDRIIYVFHKNFESVKLGL